MEVTLNFLKPFSDSIGKKEIILQLKGTETKLNTIFQKLSKEFPKFGEQVYDKDGSLSSYVSIFLNDAPLTSPDCLKSKIKNGDKLLIFFPISGG